MNSTDAPREIHGIAKTVREILSGRKYQIDYYQREYRWADKQVRELVEDLADKFLNDYEEGHPRDAVKNYGHYFLGSIILSRKGSNDFIVDGQQRLTSLTLLLVHLRHLGPDVASEAQLDQLIYSTRFGTKSFNIDVEERAACMSALFDGRDFDASESSESVQTIAARYESIEEHFPKELSGMALPYFVDWLLENVHLVEITAYADEDAYTIFETMNDRGLSLTPTEMLKGYVLANIMGDEAKIKANARWKRRVQELKELDKEGDSDAIKTWLRSQHAEKIRERKKGARAEDFDRIGTEFHRWVRDARDKLDLSGSDDFRAFIERDFDFYARQYARVIEASRSLRPGLEPIFYNAQHGFTAQYVALLAPLTPGEPQELSDRKVLLVATYLDILLNRRLWNFRSIGYSTMQYSIFRLTQDVRRRDVEELVHVLRQRLDDDTETFAANDRLRVHQQNRYYIQRILARLTDYVEQASGCPSRYLEYTTGEGKKRYEVEHIWADHPERHADEFDHPSDFAEHRNRIGGLLLLPKSFNASYGDLPYEKKLPHYLKHNLLARSLHPACYERDPGFLSFVEGSGLPFRPHSTFGREDIEERQILYRLLAERVWHPDRISA